VHFGNPSTSSKNSPNFFFKGRHGINCPFHEGRFFTSDTRELVGRKNIKKIFIKLPISASGTYRVVDYYRALSNHAT
jgi:hypothetical protein